MIFAAAVLLVAAVLLLTFFIRPADVAEPETGSPLQFLEERKAAIYESLRDLQFEYRVGKLSDEDYQRTKVGLQSELAAVLAEMEKAQPVAPEPAKAKAAAAGKKTAAQYVCPHCGARFPQPLKFCGECGKPMQEMSA